MFFRSIGITATIAALLVGVGAAPASAMGNPDPERYSDRKTHVGPDEARSEQRISCVGSDGEVYHERTTRRANEKGRDGRTTRSGDPAACEDEQREMFPGFTPPGFLGSNGPIHVETGNVRILSPGDD